MFTKINNKLKTGRVLMLTILAALTFSCETTELELVDSPNAVTPGAADINLFMNAIQVNYARFFENVSLFGMETTRMETQGGIGPEYLTAYASTRFNTPWQTAYAGVFPDVRALAPLATEAGATAHLGASQIIEAFTIITLVDYFGDVPYSEASVPGVLNPVADSGADIYAAVFDLLDDAIANLESTETLSFSTNDLFYGGDKTKWIKAANTLKIKMYLQTRLVNAAESTTQINAIIASGDYITSNDDDFAFQWRTQDNNPDARHPRFGINFDQVGNVNDYMSNHFMTELNAGYNNKTVPDPRLRYYIYRQGNRNAINTQEQDCFGGLPPAHFGFQFPFCTTDFPGYWGRDHCDNAGIPPDGALRATWGLYPVGGQFDNNLFESIPGRTIGAQGAGLSPILLASFVDFMLAEAALELGTTGDARTYLENGIGKSITKVTGFRSDLVDAGFVPSAGQITAYTNEVLAAYDAGTPDDRLDIVINEWFVAAFGNGVEPYNFYRRTGKPGELSPCRTPQTNFLRSPFYPTNYVDNNSNADQKADVFQQVFWDTNPATGFID